MTANADNSSSVLGRDSQMERLAWRNDQTIKQQIELLYEKVRSRDSHETEFLQAVHEVLMSCVPVFEKSPKYLKVMEQILEPERVIVFRVPWIDDKGIQQVNRGYRVQFSSALGPYKGGIRLHPTVNMSVMKFLGFEQIFKNSLTGTGIGGAKGGSDFDPKGKSDNEILRFIQSFMTGLWEHIGSTVDVPAGDIGVGKREIGYMYGQYKKLSHSFDGCLTGKSLEFGGSHIRPEATGYGAVYFLSFWIEKHGSKSIKDSVCVISGSGNVAQYAAELLIKMGAKTVTMSDSSGYIHEPNGFTMEQLHYIMKLKNDEKKRIDEYCKVYKSATFHPNRKPWELKSYDYAFPCATQMEIQEIDAKDIVKAKCFAVVEGANMPTHQTAIEYLNKANVRICPAKAANAGGVAVSALEMAQNCTRSQWTREEVENNLKKIMKNIYESCESYADAYNCSGDLIAGANIAGFIKVAEAVMQQGCV